MKNITESWTDESGLVVHQESRSWEATMSGSFREITRYDPCRGWESFLVLPVSS